MGPGSMRERRVGMVTAGDTPIRWTGYPSLAFGATKTKSHAPRSAQPPASAAPCTTAMTIWGSLRMVRLTWLSWVMK